MTAKLVLAHHSNTHLAPGPEMIDHHTHGQRARLHYADGIPLWEDATTFAFFHTQVDASSGRERRKEGRENEKNKGKKVRGAEVKTTD